MAKDYAKRVLMTSRKPKKKWFRIEFVIVPIFFLAFIIGYWFLTHNHGVKPEESSWLARIKNLTGHQAVKKQPAIKAAQKPAEPDIHFDFYNELPAMQVKLSVVEEDKTTAAPPPLLKVHEPETIKAAQIAPYILQFGQFKKMSDASQLRISLLLAECETEVVEINGSKGSVFRVQRGPFVSQAEAKKLQQQLQNKGVISEVKKA